MAPGAEIVTDPEMESLIEIGAWLATEPGARLAIKLRAWSATKPKTRQAIELEAELADTKKSFVLIVFIRIINISMSELYDLIKTYSNKKQANYYSKQLQMPSNIYCSTSINTDLRVSYAQALKTLPLSALNAKTTY